MLFYKLFEVDIQMLQHELKKHDWKAGCEYAFNVEGHDYYYYKSSDKLSLQRLENSQVALMLLDNRLTKNELDILTKIALESLNNAMETVSRDNRISGINHSIWAIEEIRNRKEMLMFHPDILCDLAAYWIIRDDENPMEINEQIHKEKVDLFKKNGGENPFWMEVGLGTFLPNSKELIEGLKQSWELHREQIERSGMTYESILSEIKSTST